MEQILKSPLILILTRKRENMAYRLMIVDDSNVITNRIERCFENTNIEVVAIATNGADAVLKYEQYQPDFVTMDLVMPQMDGLECIKRIVAKGGSPNILVISAMTDRMTALHALQAGARGFIYKPFSDEKLILAIKKLTQLTEKAKHKR